MIERLHLRFKAAAQNVRSRQCFERSVLSALLNGHVNSLKDRTLVSCLLGRARPLLGFQGALVSDRVNVRGNQVSVDDLVFRGDALGIVLACAKEEDEFYVVVNTLARHSVVSEHSTIWGVVAVGKAVWLATDIALPLAWKMQGPDQVLVISM